VNPTASPNKSFDSSMKQNVGQLLTVQCSSPKRNSKKTGFTQYGAIRIQKKMTILENRQNSREFPPAILGTVDSREFTSIPEREFPVALIKMKLGTPVCLGPGHIVLDGDPAPPPPKGHILPNFRPISVAAKRLHRSRFHLVWR